jgi:hypothetical protein
METEISTETSITTLAVIIVPYDYLKWNILLPVSLPLVFFLAQADCLQPFRLSILASKNFGTYVSPVAFSVGYFNTLNHPHHVASNVRIVGEWKTERMCKEEVVA